VDNGTWGLSLSVLSLICTVLIGVANHNDNVQFNAQNHGDAARANQLAESANQLSERAIGESGIANSAAERALQLSQRVDDEHQPILVAECFSSGGPGNEAPAAQTLILTANSQVFGSAQHPLAIGNPNVSWLRCDVSNDGNTTARNVQLVFHFIHTEASFTFDRKVYTDANSDRATAFFDALEPHSAPSPFYIANADRRYKAIVEPPDVVTFNAGAVVDPTSAPIRLDWGYAELKAFKE
jgi:hypothetical protein